MFETKITKDDVAQAVLKREQELRAEYTLFNKKLQAEHEIALDKLKSDHEIAIKEKEHEIKHLESETVLALKNDVVNLTKKVAVLEKENEMLGKITDLNADVIDVKSLVSDLIGKLPEIKITSLGNTVNTGK